MVLIIDAYNLIKQIMGIDFVEEGLRQRFIDRLVCYAQAKALEILLVFDGGDGFQYTKKPVTVFYSGPFETADDLIQELLANFALKAFQGQVLLVTGDRELLDLARDVKIGSISVTVFYNYLLNFEAEKKLVKINKLQPEMYQIYAVRNSELDNLMLAEELDLQEIENKELKYSPNRQSRGHTTSKNERQLKKKIGRL